MTNPITPPPITAMTQTHPITPPPDLVAKLWREASAGRDDAPIGEIFNHGIYLAYAAGADMELESCCKVLEYQFMADSIHLRAARRPKPPSLKEQALEALETLNQAWTMPKELEAVIAIRRALEALPND